MNVAAQLNPPQTVDFVNGADILTVDFSNYAILHVPSDSSDTSGGTSVTENGYLAQRGGEVAAFINNAGWLFGLTQDDLFNAYQWLAPLDSFTTLDVGPSGTLPSGFAFDNVSATREGKFLGITDTTRAVLAKLAHVTTQSNSGI